MWFLVVTRQLSCFSAFADLHGLSSLTCCFYEYIRADACCESIWLGYTAARHFFSLQLLEDKFWKVTRVNLRSLAPTSILISIWTSVLQLVLLYNDDFLLSIFYLILFFLWFWSRFDSIQSVCTITTRQLLWIQLWSGASTFDHWHAACSFKLCCTLSFGLLWSWFCLKGFWLGYLHLFLLSKSPNLLLAWGGIDVHVW